MKAKVAILKTDVGRVLEDYGRLMRMAGYDRVLSKDQQTLIKLNLSWTKYFPSCSSEPWQVEGVVKTLLEDGYRTDRLHPIENKTVVTEPWKGARNNRWLPVLDRYGLKFQPLTEVKWTVYRFKSKLLMLDRIFPEGIEIPEMYIGKQILHLPTLKTHGHSVTTGAIKNAFGGLLKEVRHYAHKHIHEVLVDLMLMQRELHPAVFAVMDGTVCGDGAGPRTMFPKVKDYLLASADSVAIDAVAAAMMGFDPMSIKYIRLAHERGLGCGDLRQIELAGDADADAERWRLTGPYARMTFASRMQHRIYWGRLRGPIEWSLKTVLAPWAYLASVLYHDSFWYPLFARDRMRVALESEWGRLFQNWERLTPDARGFPDVGDGVPALRRTGLRAFGTSLKVLATCLREAPELTGGRTRGAPREGAGG